MIDVYLKRTTADILLIKSCDNPKEKADILKLEYCGTLTEIDPDTMWDEAKQVVYSYQKKIMEKWLERFK